MYKNLRFFMLYTMTCHQLFTQQDQPLTLSQSIFVGGTVGAANEHT